MTRPGAVESFDGGAARRANGIYPMALLIASVLCGAGLVLSAVFAIGDSEHDAIGFGVLGVPCLGAGWIGLRTGFDARSMRPAPTLGAGVIAYLFVAAVSVVAYLVTGAFSRLDDALYESVAGVSTSSLTLLDDPAVLSRGELVWRSSTQWIGGLLAVGLGVGLLPFLGGSRELADPRRRSRARNAMAARPLPALKRVATIYVIVSVAVWAAFAAAGMGLHDSVVHMLSTVSTGGFSSHADSIAHFDSRLIETVMMAAMAGAAVSVALVWMVWRRQLDDALRVFELRLFLGVLLGATALVTWLNRTSDAGLVDRIWDAAFTVVALATTTGHRVADWGAWQPGAVMVLLLLLVVGGMAGSVAGGLRWIRVIGLAQFVWRELQRQVHPRTVRAVKVGDASISEASVDRMFAQLVYLVVIGATAAIVLGFFVDDVLQAASLAFSALTTAGPGVDGEGFTIVTASDLSRSARWVLMLLMIAGRVALYPAFVLVGLAYFGGQRTVDRARRRPTASGSRR